jgi:hypothetical protein
MKKREKKPGDSSSNLLRATSIFNNIPVCKVTKLILVQCSSFFIRADLPSVFPWISCQIFRSS